MSADASNPEAEMYQALGVQYEDILASSPQDATSTLRALVEAQDTPKTYLFIAVLTRYFFRAPRADDLACSALAQSGLLDILVDIACHASTEAIAVDNGGDVISTSEDLLEVSTASLRVHVFD